MGKNSEENRVKRAFLVSVYKNSAHKALCLEHLQELAFLVDTYGLTVVGKTSCYIRKYEAATFITEGKLVELIQATQETEADVIIFDDEISPAQQRNLEKAFAIPVMDRTEVILEVFAQRAQTKEARLQIELAQVKYQAPRLKKLWTHLSRQAGSSGGGSGGGGYLKGEGEKQIEIDRRILKKQIDNLQKEIKAVRAIRETQRGSRAKSGEPLLAIIGYTNAGKSTLLNALTASEVFVENKLFATLDTTTRKFTLSNNQDVLLIDTVGFIRKLPHLLVAAFKSTLEEAFYADILIHLVDSSHPMALEQAETTFEVLKELQAENKPIITVLNKVDAVKDPAIVNQLRLKYPKTVCISALHHTGFAELEELIVKELTNRRQLVQLVIPQKDYGVVSDLISYGQIISQDYEENDILLKMTIPVALAGKYEKYLVKSP